MTLRVKKLNHQKHYKVRPFYKQTFVLAFEALNRKNIAKKLPSLHFGPEPN
jgi:hypothetical protein